MENYTEFQSLLEKLIGNESLASFAHRADISREHLSRMLSSNPKSRPSKTTLGKIAAAAKADTAELFRTCGYTINETRNTVWAERRNMTIPQRVEATADDILRGFGKLIASHGLFKNFVEIEKAFNDVSADGRPVMCVYSHETFVPISEESEGKPNNTPHSGELYLPCSLYWEMILPRDNDDNIRLMFNSLFALFYVKTTGGNIIITDVAVDGRTVNACGLVPPAMADSMYEDGEDVNKLPYVVITKKIKIPKGNSAEELLLKAIFGENDTSPKNRLFTIEAGLGFFWTETPSTFGVFLDAHRDSFIQAEKTDDRRIEERIELCDEVADMTVSEEIDAAFSRYGWESKDAIIRIMDYELKQQGLLSGKYCDFVKYVSNQEDPSVDLLPVVFVSDAAWTVDGVRIDGEKRLEFDAYVESIARELHLPSCGDVIAYYTIDCNVRGLQRELTY